MSWKQGLFAVPVFIVQGMKRSQWRSFHIMSSANVHTSIIFLANRNQLLSLNHF